MTDQNVKSTVFAWKNGAFVEQQYIYLVAPLELAFFTFDNTTYLGVRCSVWCVVYVRMSRVHAVCGVMCSSQ